jgi:hypothetical protein
VRGLESPLPRGRLRNGTCQGSADTRLGPERAGPGQQGQLGGGRHTGAAERAALRFADLFATDHLAIDDSVYDDLRQFFSEGELVEIGLNCALDVGIGRLAATWRVTDDLEGELRDSEGQVLSPWGRRQLIVR